MAHGVGRGLEASLAGDAQLALEVEVRRGDEGVDPPARGGRERLARPVDVASTAARKPGNHRPAHLEGHPPHGLGVVLGRNRKPRLDDVHAQRIELPGHAQFLVDRHRETGGLFAVAQRCVEHRQPVGHVNSLT